VIFVRTGGGGDRPLVDRGPFDGTSTPPGTGPALHFARAGFAGVQIDGPIGGLRNTTNGDEQFLIFNVFNASALRDNVRQSAMELSLLARALPALDFDSLCGRIKFDPDRLAIMGHSMGSWIAPVTMAYEPSLKAGIFSGAGGSYIANVMDKQHPLKVRPLAEILLDYNMDQRSLDWHDPALTIVQWAAEPSDPQAYDGLVHANILMLQGIVDHYILPSIANATSLALGLDLAGPAYDATNAEEQMLHQPALTPLLPLVGRSAISLPAQGNKSGLTALVIQHPGDALQDGHEVVFQTEPPKHQYRCFLSSFAQGVPSVPTDGAADDPCR
jgi:pimeloyl-ACP methyl ester carboxylesterase